VGTMTWCNRLLGLTQTRPYSSLGVCYSHPDMPLRQWLKLRVVDQDGGAAAAPAALSMRSPLISAHRFVK
jgi:hypothetical protein